MFTGELNNMRSLRLAVLIWAVASLFLVAHTTAEAKDEWLQVRSKNFFLVGNAAEKDIRKVATKLEQFRETFRQLFPGAALRTAVPTNVVVFKSNSAYKPFKPKRADGKIDNFVAGYFQPGEDVNYITLTTEGEDAEMFGTIFHEYVHFIVNTNFGKAGVPAWFNEGLAEYYQTFAIEADQNVKLGLPQSGHLQFLQQSKFIPLDELFKVTHFQLQQTGSHSRSIFYAESWALLHYMIQGGKSDAMNKFLGMMLKDVPQEKAFQDAFQMSYAAMEKELRKYVGKSTYQYVNIAFKNKLVFDTEMQVSPLDEAESNAYLGDLLYHVNRADDAEPFLLASLKLKPQMSMANLTLGMVKMRQRKWDEARAFLEKAIVENQKNHMAYYRYAYLLSREGRDEFGYVSEFPKESAAKMREALKKAITINPEFTESYELYAFISLVNNEELAESAAMLQKALGYQPGNQRYALRIAEIYNRLQKFADARAIAERIARTSDNEEVKSRAEGLVANIKQREEFEQRMADARKRNETVSSDGGVRMPILQRRAGEKPPSPEQLAKLSEEANIRSINDALRKPGPEDKRVIGIIQKIECKGSAITYTVKTDSETFALTSKDFDALAVNSFVQEANTLTIGCGENLSGLTAVITYKDKTIPKTAWRGDLLGLEFIPKNFRLMTDQELAAPMIIAPTPDGSPGTEITSNQSPQTLEPPRGTEDREAMRRQAMMAGIRSALREPQADEKRELAYLDKIECTSKGVYLHMRTETQTLKLLNVSPRTLPIRMFTRDLEGLQLGCAIKPVEVPAVVIYTLKPDAKSKTAGEVVSLDFVPKSFTLN